MEFMDIIVIAILGAIVGGAVGYIIKAKKSGQKCIGCPYSKTCHGSCGACASHTPGKDESSDNASNAS